VKNHNQDTEKVAEVIQFVRKSGGLEYAQAAMNQYKNDAFDILEYFEPSETRESLKDLVNYVTERKK
jgi:octaprenyl-diphosphate synthase